jgi:hypothetical protein
LKDKSSLVRGYANTVTLQDKTQDQAQRDEAQKSKNKKNNSSKNKARKCVYKDIYEFEECLYIVSSTRKFD